MDTLIKADIFFFVCTVGFVLLAVIGALVLVQSVLLLQKMNRIAARIEKNINAVSAETEALIEDVRESALFRFLFGRRRTARSRKT
ncbi:MAG TPA: hypothetical protein VLB02_00775 [Candidatus Paceibacterota bacterium]|nr:hypothetical protein [Candidatus Paceibacterota bacterium]